MAAGVHPQVVLEALDGLEGPATFGHPAQLRSRGVYDHRSALDVGPYAVRPRSDEERELTLQHRARFADTWTRIRGERGGLHAHADDVSVRTGGQGGSDQGVDRRR
jgi:hypothetical protein